MENQNGSKNSTNSPVPADYIGDVQYSRLYALAYLDQQLRESKLHGNAYKQYMSEQISLIRDSSGKNILDGLAQMMGGQDIWTSFQDSIPNSEQFLRVYLEHTRYLLPHQPFKDAMEENPFWAATNSIAYIYLLSCFIQKTKDEAVNGHFVDALFHTAIQPDAEAVKIILLNMLFVKPVQIDPVPSVLDGYSFSTLEDIVRNPACKAITLPSNATCC